MSEHSNQEKTERATPKRLKDAREKGQSPKSRDLNTVIILLVGTCGLLISRDHIARNIAAIAEFSFHLEPDQLSNPQQLLLALQQFLGEVLITLLPIMLLLFFAALTGPLLLHGFQINFVGLAPKFSRLSFAKGIKRIFSLRSMVELSKTFLKFVLIAVIAYMVIHFNFSHMQSLSHLTLQHSVKHMIDILIWSFIALCSGQLLIAGIDIPYQLWEHYRSLKMTKQEVKDEFKEAEGRPEVKSHIRQMQQEMSKARMMEAVPDADVVITNPTHYSVAIRYDKSKSKAPIVVAKGRDFVAFRIRDIAKQNKVTIVSAPPLARSVYHTTPVDAEIPHGLYVAVAHILAYVYQLKRHPSRTKLRQFNDLPIPDGLKF